MWLGGTLKNPPTLTCKKSIKNLKNTRKSSSLLNVMVSYSCDEHIFGMGFNVFECAGEAILEDAWVSSHGCLAKVL